MKTLKRFIKDGRGLETSEYAIMLVLIAIALIVAIGVLRTAIADAFNDAPEINIDAAATATSSRNYALRTIAHVTIDDAVVNPDAGGVA